MYVARVKSKGKNGKSFVSILLRQSTRVGQKVKTKTIAVLTHMPKHVIASVEKAIKEPGADSLKQIKENEDSPLTLRNGLSFGAIWTVHQVAKQLAIPQTIGKGFFAQLMLWQVLARLLFPSCSLLAMVRKASESLACSVLAWKQGFDENDLYESSEWIDENQKRIEKKLFENRQRVESLYLYDVTSSYFEGEHNELANYGYNRDKKKGKKQVVIGLLTDSQGQPCSIRVFEGNTGDTSTFAQNISTLKKEFGCSNITVVGDRGMIKGPQIGQCQQESYHYITAINKPQIEKLLKEGKLQMELFDEQIREIEDKESAKRYILKRNPIRAAEMQSMRRSKLSHLQNYVGEEIEYQKEHPKARWETRLKNVHKKIEQLQLNNWVEVCLENEELHLEINQAALKEESRLDGCYAIITDLSQEQASKEEVHDRYKDLSKVERDFRSMKTGHLEIRPWYVRTQASTRAHAFTAMLSLKLRQHLEKNWQDLDLTVEEGLELLSQWNVQELVDTKTNTVLCRKVPQPNKMQQKLLAALGLKAPEKISLNQVNVVTHKKLSKQRKTA